MIATHIEIFQDENRLPDEPEEKYCESCGVEITSELELGLTEEYNEMRSIIPGSMQKQRIIKYRYLCKDCKAVEDEPPEECYIDSLFEQWAKEQINKPLVR